MPADRTEQVRRLLEKTLTEFVASPPATGGLDVTQRLLVDDLLARADAVRDAALVVLGFMVTEGAPLDVRDPSSRLEGDRAVSGYLGRDLLRTLGIAGVNDAFEGSSLRHNYMSDRVRRGGMRKLVAWAADESRTIDEVVDVFRALAAGIAATAHRVPALPELDHRRLTFRRMTERVDRMLGVPSAGAHEQFLFAALLGAVVDETDRLLHVETKSLNSSDRSARTAADVQIVRGQSRVVEAFEVSASEWSTKVDQAVDILNDRDDLQRVHIVANAPDVNGDEIQSALGSVTRPGTEEGRLDISVLDVRAECLSLVARASRHGRKAAIEYLYDHLVYRQPRSELVEKLVENVRDLDLVLADP